MCVVCVRCLCGVCVCLKWVCVWYVFVGCGVCAWVCGACVRVCGVFVCSALHLCRCCSKMEQLFLQAVTAEIQRTGVEETVFEKVYVQLKTLCVFDGK